MRLVLLGRPVRVGGLRGLTTFALIRSSTKGGCLSHLEAWGSRTLRDSDYPIAPSVPLPLDAGSMLFPRAKPLDGVYTSLASRKLGVAPLVGRPQPYDGICCLFVCFLSRLFVSCLFVSLSISRAEIFELASGPSVVRKQSRLVASRASLRSKNALSRAFSHRAGRILAAQVSLSPSYVGGC